MNLINLKKFFSVTQFFLFSYGYTSIIMRFAFTINIYLLHFITENRSAYLVYLFLVYFVNYANKNNCVYYQEAHFFALFILTYVIFMTLLLYTLCKIKITRKFLDNLLTREFIVHHLGLYTVSKVAIGVLTPPFAAALTEAYTASKSLEALTTGVEKDYKALYSTNPEFWPAKKKEAFLKDMHKARFETTHGLISKVIGSDETKAYYDSVSGTVKGVFKSVFKS